MLWTGSSDLRSIRLTFGISLTDQAFLLKASRLSFKALFQFVTVSGLSESWRRVSRVSFQLSILKILAGQPDGVASLEVVKQHLAIFYTSGPEWPARMKRLLERAPNLDIFGQQFVTRELGSWRITEAGRCFLEQLERSVGTTLPLVQDYKARDPVPVIVAMASAPKRRLEYQTQKRRNRSKRGGKRKA